MRGSMDVSDLKRIRDEAVSKMNGQIDLIEPVDLPWWLLMTMMLPVFFISAVQMTVRMLFAFIIGLVKSPFSFLAIWVDLLSVMWWFLKSSVERMSKK